MTAAKMFTIQIDGARNRVRVRWIGRVTVGGANACLKDVEQVLPELRPGFTVLTDLSALESMELECAGPLAKIMEVTRVHGVGTVVRVVPDPRKDIGFNILSIIHYRRGVKIITCETLAEAEKVLE